MLETQNVTDNLTKYAETRMSNTFKYSYSQGKKHARIRFREMKTEDQNIFLNTIMRVYEHAKAIQAKLIVLYVYIYKLSHLSMGHDNEPSLILDY